MFGRSSGEGLGVVQNPWKQTPNPQSYPGHEEESIERLKIVNSMKEKIQQAFGVWLVCLFQSQDVQADFTKMQNGVWN
jgi:hypothetical protein